MFDDLITEFKQRGSVTFPVRVVPDAPHTLASERLADGSIKIRLAAPAEGGKANMELLRYLSQRFAVQKTQARLVSGVASRHKLVRINASNS